MKDLPTKHTKKTKMFKYFVGFWAILSLFFVLVRVFRRLNSYPELRLTYSIFINTLLFFAVKLFLTANFAK
jgi:hypothetical protein